MGADFYNSVETIKERLTDKAIPIETPTGPIKANKKIIK